MTITPASITDVIPAADALGSQRSRLAPTESNVKGSLDSSTLTIAGGSIKYPVGSPVLGSRSKRLKPGKGSGVSFVIPASCNALELTHAQWMSMAHRNTGLSGQIASRSSLRGPDGGNAMYRQPNPRMSFPLGFVFAYAASTSSNFSRVSYCRSTPWLSAEPVNGCVCASTKPGISIFPRRSTTSVFLVTKLFAPAVSPTYAIRLPRTATAWAHGCLESTV